MYDERTFLDFDATRTNVYDSVLSGLQSRFPIENDKFRLELSDLEWDGPEKPSKREAKDAILRRRSLVRPVKGTWRLIDRNTGDVVDETRNTVLRVPMLTDRGTYVLGGNNYTLSNQARLRSGVYTRRKANDELEAHFNVLEGGPSFRLYMEPSTGVYRMQLGQSRMKLYPLLRAMGITDEEMEKYVGPEITKVNSKIGEDPATVKKAIEKLGRTRARKEAGDMTAPELASIIQGMALNPEVTSRTLGTPYDHVTPEVILRTMSKLVQISRGEADVDDRDSMTFQETYSAEDFFRERIEKDAGQAARRLLWRATMRKNLGGLEQAPLQKSIEMLFQGSGLASPAEETNPVDVIDQNLRVTRMGEGGIPSDDVVPDEARAVQPSHFMFVDAVRSPESGRVGVDQRLTIRARRGADRKLRTPMLDRTGKEVWVTPEMAADAVVAFPGEIEAANENGYRKVAAMSGGKLTYVDKDTVDFSAPSGEDMFTLGSLLVPGIGGIKGGRLLMGGKFSGQALPLVESEAPFVTTAVPGNASGRTYHDVAGDYSGVVRSTSGGIVESVDQDMVRIRTPEGEIEELELYDNFPLNRKTFLSNIPVVAPGQKVKPGGLVARNNFTDDTGRFAIGRNLRVAYLPYKGWNFEDAIVLSESASKKLSSENMFTKSLDQDSHTRVDPKKYQALFHGKFTDDQLSKIGDNGAALPGSVLYKGDPIILATEQRLTKGAGQQLYRGSKGRFSDASVLWDHDEPATVTDVFKDRHGVNVALKAVMSVRPGDKLAGAYGDKGVVGKIVPDHDMPTDEEGRPLDIIVPSLGVISRINPAQVAAAMLGKVAEKTGESYALPAFPRKNMIEFALDEMKSRGIKSNETLYDPLTRRNIPDVFVGSRYYMRLHHMAEDKETSRALGSYSADGEPSPSVDGPSPRRFGLGEVNSLIAHGAVENLREIRMIKGQRNDDWWNAFIQGYPPPTPEIPGVYRKYMASLQAAGVNVHKDGNYMHLSAMTDKDVENLSRGEITNPKTVRWFSSYGKEAFGEKSMDPETGGLFDLGLTGGHHGGGWSHIQLDEPVPNPVMEGPVRRLLGLTQVKMENILAGKEDIGTYGTGGEALRKALAAIDVDREIEVQRDKFKTAGSVSARNEAVRRLKDLDGLKRTGVNPADLMITKVPVLPPLFRPITATNKFNAVSGVNELYQDLINARDDLRQASGMFEGDPVYDTRKTVYHAARAVVGIGDPVKAERKQNNVRGILKEVFGTSPKLGTVQRRLIGTNVDLGGRAVITPNPALDMDQVGIPEESAWELFSPFVARRLIRRYGGSKDARLNVMKQIKDRTPTAREALVEEMNSRAVLASRAPVLHKYGVMAFRPVISPTNTLQVSPQIVVGFNADFDGDAMQFHVTTTDEATEEAFEKMLPSRNLRSVSDFKAMYGPRQEFLQGLYLASTRKSNKTPRVFSSAEDVEKAYRAGKINIDDPVIIRET